LFLYRFILVFVALCWFNIAFSQAQNIEEENYRLLSVDKGGLPSSEIRCFAKDSEGFMWIGTAKGLVRYDGSEVILYQHNDLDSNSISGNYIRAIAMEGDSVMWVATARNGLNKYSFATRKFKNYNPKANDPSSLPSKEVIALDIDQLGTLWVGFHRGDFCKYNRKEDKFERIQLPIVEGSVKSRSNGIIRKFLFDEDNPKKMWLFTEGDLMRYNDEDKSFKLYSYPIPKGHAYITGLRFGIKGMDGKLYIPAYRKGVLVFDPKTEQWSGYNERVYDPMISSQNSYSVIQQIDEFTFWLGSPRTGLAVLDIRKGYIEPISMCKGVEDPRDCKIGINCFDMDTDGGHWIGTTEGLRYYNKMGNQFKVVSHTAQKKNLKGRSIVWTIVPFKKEGIYFTGHASEGVYYYNLATETVSLIHPPKKYQPGNKVKSFNGKSMIYVNDSTIIVLSSNALFKLNPLTRQLTEINTGLIHQKDYYIFNKMYLHSTGALYLTTRTKGVFVLDKNFKFQDHLMHSNTNSNSLSTSSYIYELTEDPDGFMWIGGEDGFSKYDPVHKTFDNFDYKSRIDSIPQLKIVHSIILAPDSSLWFIDGRANGVYLEYPYSKPYHFKPIITGPNNLKEKIYNVLFSRTGKTFIATELGLSIIQPNKKLQRFGKKQGLPGLSSLSPIVELANNEIVLGAGKKMIFFHPDSLFDFPNNLPIFISSISIFNETYDVDLNQTLQEGLELTYLQNFFSIKVGTINFDNPEEYTLSYRLKGLSDAWITTNNKKAVFTHIPGGDYVFEAKFVDRNSNVLKQKLSMNITIIPPFWKTWWFKTLGAILIGAIGLAFYIIRINALKRENKLKIEFNKQLANMELTTLRSQMNPHFIFNSLNSIRHKVISNDPVAADKFLVKFSRLIRNVLQNSRVDIINLGKELDTLELYMEIESSRFDDKFDFSINVSEDVNVKELKIPPLLLQPYVENAIWHGLMQKEGGGKVSIDVSRKNNLIYFVIEDNGVGRKRAKELKSKKAVSNQSMGIGITGNRLEIIQKLYQIRCEAEIIDLINTENEALGTRVVLIIPPIYDS